MFVLEFVWPKKKTVSLQRVNMIRGSVWWAPCYLFLW